MRGSEAATASRSARPAGLPGPGSGRHRGRHGIEVRRESRLTEVDGEAGRAVIADTKAGTKETVDFDLLHAVPPQSAANWVKQSPLADPAVPPGTWPPASTP